MTQQSSSTSKQSNSVPDATREGHSTASDARREVTSQAKETVGQVTEQAQQAAGQVVDQARQQVSSRMAGQKDRAAEGLTSVAQALRQTSQQLREQDQQTVTGYIESAASQVERVSNYLKQNDLGGLIDDVEHFARRQPALFLGGTFVLGLIGARFLKSSRPATGLGGRYSGSTALAQRQPAYQNMGSTRFQNFGASTGVGMRSGTSTTSGRTTSTQSYASGNGPRSYDSRSEE
jgi:vacuolar-type H+-ATPase subunit H